MIYNWLGANIVPLVIPYSLALAVLIAGSLSDLKTREVPDWVNYGLIGSGVLLNLLFSVIYSDISFIINSLIGLAIFFGIAYIMFYAGQWGGGDSKMIMGLGAVIGINPSSFTAQFLFGFFINMLFAGAIYGIVWSIFLAVKNRKKFLKEMEKSLAKKNAVKAKKLLLIGAAAIIILVFIAESYLIKSFLLMLALLGITTFYLWAFARAVEKSCMHRLVEPSKVTEGDWIVKDIFAGKEYIAGPKDLGIEKKQIKRLIELHRRGKIKNVLIKEGIPFVPSFLIAFIITFLFGNPMMWMI